MNNKLKNKVAIITGASKGIGASIAKHFAEEGAKVVVNYASSKEGADVAINLFARFYLRLHLQTLALSLQGALSDRSRCSHDLSSTRGSSHANHLTNRWSEPRASLWNYSLINQSI